MHVLDLQALNRTTLARQGLLERATDDVVQAVRGAGGLQAQLPRPPVIGLWSRVAGFSRAAYREAVADGRLVRGTTLRGTLHLHEVDDYRALRATLQPMLDALARGQRGRVREQDVAPAVAHARAMLERGGVSVGQLKAELAERFPQSLAQGLANIARMRIALLLEPDLAAPDGWKAGSAPLVRAVDVVGDTLAPADPEALVRRFLEVLGPGSVKDVQTWSSMRGLAPVARRMLEAGELVTVLTWEGDELLDLPDARRLDGDVAAPPRFLPMWDDVLLSHADRSRVVDPAHRPYLASRNGMSPPTYLLDGFVHGTWRVRRESDAAILELSPFTAIPTRHEDALVAEGEALLELLEPDAGRRSVRVGRA